MGDLISHARFFHRRNCISTTNYSNGAALGYGPSNTKSPLCEAGEFKNTHWAVPHHGPRTMDDFGISLDGFRANIQNAPANGYRSGGDHFDLRISVELVPQDEIDRQAQFGSGH